MMRPAPRVYAPPGWSVASSYHWTGPAGLTVCAVFVYGRWLFELWQPAPRVDGRRPSPSFVRIDAGPWDESAEAFAYGNAIARPQASGVSL